MGGANCSKKHVNKWYTELRNSSGTQFLRGQVSSITRARLYELGRHFALYQKTQYDLAYDKTPDTIFGEPKFRRRDNWKVSLPLVFTRDNTVGPAKFVSDRDIHISRFGNLRISRPIPDGYEPHTARLIYDKDGRWRLVIQCKVRDNTPPPEIPYRILGIDRNMGNIALSNGQILEPPERVTDGLQQLQTTGERIQRKMARRKKPNRKRQTPDSNRYNKQARRLARNRRKIKDTRHTITHKKFRIIADTTKDVVLERLRTTNMTKSAKGTKENPGRNVAQKSGLNKSILGQNWYELEQQVRYKIVGDTHKVEAHYTSQRCHMCAYTVPENRSGRYFKCQACGFETHADANASYNIEVRHTGNRLASYVEEYVANTQVMGCLDVEGSCISSPVNRQTLTGVGPPVRMVILWDDV